MTKFQIGDIVDFKCNDTIFLKQKIIEIDLIPNKYVADVARLSNLALVMTSSLTIADTPQLSFAI